MRAHASLLDPVPESFRPAVMVVHEFGPNLESIIILVSALLIAGLLLSLMVYKPGIRKKPYSLLSC